MTADKSDPGAPDADNTPLDEDESAGLIPPHIETRQELNQWEASNIAVAQEWAATHAVDILSVDRLMELHRRMFDDTWSWAGQFRRSDKNLTPYSWTEVPRLMQDLVEKSRVRYEHSPKSPEALDELAVRFHHELVHIHPWPNGNGRHARLATDLLLRQWSRPPFTWGSSTKPSVRSGARTRYINALKAADAGDLSPLLRFARS